MNGYNALGFASIGLVMKFFPVLLPTLAGPGFGATNRGIWLAFMSFVMMGVALTWLASRTYVEVKARWTWSRAAWTARRAANPNGAPVAAPASRARLST